MLSFSELRGHVKDLRDEWAQAKASDDNRARSEEHTSELQSHSELVCRILLEKKKQQHTR